MNLDRLTFQKVAKLTDEQARKELEAIRWPHGPACPRCGSMSVVSVAGGRQGLYRCTDCRTAKASNDQFTVTVGTIFEDSHIPLSKWVQAFSIVCASKKGVSALQLQRQLELGSYRSAWHMAHRIRHAMSTSGRGPKKLRGVVEVDETFVGGKPRNKARANRGKMGRGTVKAPVVAIVERDGRVRAFSVDRISADKLKVVVQENVSKKARLMTDEFTMYRKIGKEFASHETVKHSAGEYARGDAHINTCESWFALLKRGVHGTFHVVSRTHLGRYCDEFEFRWDTRHKTDGGRTVAALDRAEGRRLMYRDLVRTIAV